MHTLLTARKLACFGLLAALLPYPGSAVAAEAMNNSSLSDSYVADSAPPVTACKAPSATHLTAGKTACPASSAPLVNPAQDAVVRQTLAEDSVHSITIIDGLPGNAQLIQNIENDIVGATTTPASGGISYTSHGLNTPSGGDPGGSGRFR